MTKEQIGSVLTELGYNFNTMISLQEVSSIYLCMDHVIYPGNTTRFEFKTTDNCNLLLMYEGYEDTDGTFHSVSRYPKSYFTFDSICGFTMVSKFHERMSYLIGKAV